MLEAGRIPLRPEKIPERVTYHDPCNIARVGRITEQPREILRHIWLRGAGSMQIFNHPRKGKRTIAIEELADAVSVYDELLAHRPFLDRGTVMNTDAVEATFDGAIWSGLKLPDQALVRAFTQSARPVTFEIQPWPGASRVELSAPPNGATYLLTNRDGKVNVRVNQVLGIR